MGCSFHPSFQAFSIEIQLPTGKKAQALGGRPGVSSGKPSALCVPAKGAGWACKRGRWNLGVQGREEILLPDYWVHGQSHIIVVITNTFEAHRPVQNNVINKGRHKAN